MAYDEELAERVRAALSDEEVGERKMFGGLAFMWRGHMLCGITRDELFLRLGPEGGEAALEEPHVRPMQMGASGRTMRGMVSVDPPGRATDEALAGWLRRAREYAASLPRKTK
jgi:TfoX/Sxy family transcriptional regulator of competence genes